MRIMTLASAALTVLLILSTMICGFWIRANNVTDPSSFSFHMNCGVASVVFSLITLVMVIVMLVRTKKKEH